MITSCLFIKKQGKRVFSCNLLLRFGIVFLLYNPLEEMYKQNVNIYSMVFDKKRHNILMSMLRGILPFPAAKGNLRRWILLKNRVS